MARQTQMSAESISELSILRSTVQRKLGKLDDQPPEASVVYDVLADMIQASPFDDYGCVWIPDIARGLGISAERIDVALKYLADLDFVDLYWAPGTYHDGSFTLGESVSQADAKMLVRQSCGGVIGYARIRNDHPLRNSKSKDGLFTWRQIADDAWKARTGRSFTEPKTDAAIHKLLDAGAPLIVSWGIGRDSTAMLIEFVRMKLVPAAILYAEVGNEKPETSAYKPYFERYLAKAGFPRVQTVKYVVGHGEYCTLEEECLFLGALPSIAYGYSNRKCSAKWKVVPQEKFVRGMPVAHEAWRKGLPVVRAVGFDSSPEDLKRRDRAVQNAMFVNWYPMQEWKWDLDQVKAEIRAEGLEVPVKSACFFCSASKEHEVEELALRHPEYVPRIADIEERGKIKSTDAEGLWFKARKGTRSKLGPRPGSWIEYLRMKGLA